MSAESVVCTYDAGRIGSVKFGINAIVFRGQGASLALSFRTDDVCGLSVGFHGTTDDARAFAAELVRHADLADAKQAELDAEVSP